MEAELSQMGGLVPLQKRFRVFHLPPPPCKDPAETAAICKPGSGASANTTSAGTLIVQFPTSRTVKNKCCVSHLVYGIFCDSSLDRLRPEVGKELFLKALSGFIND